MSNTPPRPGSLEPISSSSSVVQEAEADPTPTAAIEDIEDVSNLDTAISAAEPAYTPIVDVNLVAETEAQDEDDQPVTTSVPKEMSPVSPVPLHVPEPSKIPLLLDPALSRTIPNEEQIPPDIGSALSDPSFTGSNILAEEAAKNNNSNASANATETAVPASDAVESTEDPLMQQAEASEDGNPFTIEQLPVSEAPGPSSSAVDTEMTGTSALSENTVDPRPMVQLEDGVMSEPNSATQQVNLQALLANLGNQPFLNNQDIATQDFAAAVMPNGQVVDPNAAQPMTSPITSLPQAPTFPALNTSNDPSQPIQPFQTSPTSLNHPTNLRHPLPENPTTVPFDDGEGEVPFTLEEENGYESFLNVERDYVAKGEWSRFPVGSRLFIGNLSSERVSKRDIYRVFAKYGKLAQISIKQAFGFVQFFDVSACTKALRDEQGTAVRGRKMHLEISKPQRNTRNNEGQAPTRSNGNLRRSRSPEDPISPRNRGSNYRGQAYDDRNRERDRDRDRDVRERESRNSRDGGARRSDEYRPSDRRMSSPRSEYGRERDDYYNRNSHRGRSRSPRGRYRSPTPPSRRSFDNASNTNGNNQRSAPLQPIDALIVVFDQLDYEYIRYVDNNFRDRRLRTDVLHMTARIQLESYIKRRIVEGCQAVVFLTRQTQGARKVSIQIFKGDGSNAGQYDEYDMVDAAAAAELVLRATSSRPSQYNIPNSYPNTAYPPQSPTTLLQQNPASIYGVNPQQAAPMPVAPPALNPANLTGIIQSLDPASLQGLLTQLQAQQQQQAVVAAPPAANPYMQAIPSMPKQADLSALLGAASRGQQQQPYGNIPSGIPGYQNNPALVGLLGGLNQRNPQGAPAQQPQPNQQVQNIMSQLTGQWTGGR